MTNATLPPIFIINMDKDKNRRKTMESRAKAADISVEFFPAVNGRAMSDKDIASCYDSAKRKRYFGRDMNKGEIGCLLSHRNIFEKMIKDNLPYAVILEDDVIFEPDFKEVLAALMISPVEWDVIRFLGSKKIYKRGCRKITPLGDTRYQFARLPTAPGGGHGYLMTLKAAKVMTHHMQRNWVPIDTMQGRIWQTGLETLVLYPAPLFPDPEAETTIGDDRLIKHVDMTGFSRAIYPLTRTWFKLCENLGKRWVYLSSWPRDQKH